MAYKIAKDKKKHFLVGVPLGILLQLLATFFFPQQPLMATFLNLIFLTAICYGFELLSLITGKGHADNLDAIAGIIGGATGIALYFFGGMLL